MTSDIRTGSAAGSGADLLAGVALETFRFHIGGRDWAIRAARDHAALLDIADRFAEFPFGLLLWESAPVLAGALAERAADVKGRRVLELGAGVGFPGIIAAWLGAASVWQTDHATEALDLARANAQANSVNGIVHMQLDWHAEPTALPDAAGCDLVIASDVLYDRAAHESFAAVLDCCLAPGGTVLLTDPGRQDTPAFLEAMAQAGWRVTRDRRTTQALLPGGADTVDVDVIALTRP